MNDDQDHQSLENGGTGAGPQLSYEVQQLERELNFEIVQDTVQTAQKFENSYKNLEKSVMNC